MTANVPELPSASTCLAQISVDLGSLSEEFLQDMVKGMELDETLPPVEAVKSTWANIQQGFPNSWPWLSVKSTTVRPSSFLRS
jgi:hypothetical protein